MRKAPASKIVWQAGREPYQAIAPGSVVPIRNGERAQPQESEARGISQLAVSNRLLWRDRPALIFVVRQPGHQFDRSQSRSFSEWHPAPFLVKRAALALLLSSIHDFLDQLHYNLIAILPSQDEDGPVFDQSYFAGSTYVDTTLAFHRALRGGALQRPELSKASRRTSFKERCLAITGVNQVSSSELAKRGIDGPLGGLLLVDEGDRGIIYQQMETSPGNYGSLEPLLRAAHVHASSRFSDTVDLERAITRLDRASSGPLHLLDDTEIRPRDIMPVISRHTSASTDTSRPIVEKVLDWRTVTFREAGQTATTRKRRSSWNWRVVGRLGRRRESVEVNEIRVEDV